LIFAVLNCALASAKLDYYIGRAELLLFFFTPPQGFENNLGLLDGLFARVPFHRDNLHVAYEAR
jgi:hypothetical protein